MNNPFIALTVFIMLVSWCASASGQQPAAVKPATLPVATQPAPDPVAPPRTQAVQPPSDELATVAAAWADMKTANLSLQLAVTKVQLAHPGWKYDYQAQTFFVELPAMPQPPAPPPAAVAAPVKMPQPPAVK